MAYFPRAKRNIFNQCLTRLPLYRAEVKITPAFLIRLNFSVMFTLGQSNSEKLEFSKKQPQSVIYIKKHPSNRTVLKMKHAIMHNRDKCNKCANR